MGYLPRRGALNIEVKPVTGVQEALGHALAGGPPPPPSARVTGAQSWAVRKTDEDSPQDGGAGAEHAGRSRRGLPRCLTLPSCPPSAWTSAALTSGGR